MTLDYTDTKELVAERFNRLIQSNQAIREEYLDYAKQFYPKTVEAYRKWQAAATVLDDVMGEELPGD